PVSFPLGDILKFLVQLVFPSWDFELPEPWNAIASIAFQDVTLEFDLVERSITLETAIQADFAFINITHLSLTYYRKSPKHPRAGVVVALEGRFLGLQITTQNPYPPKSNPNQKALGWDVINDHPPEVTGHGPHIFELYYLGIGQHISFRDASRFKDIGGVMKALETSFKPASGEQAGAALAKADQLVFNDASGWLVGTKFVLLETVTLSAIFNDPELYGLRIALAGPRAKALKGLEFEILYKKITETIGLYHIELKLPDVMRHLEFGEVSITLPVIDVDIYTNANFRIDMGFPHHGNFANSAGVQVFPFVGAGGFYFALLDGATSKTVPQVTNGQFKPVIEAGVGLRVGVGKTIEEGPLSAGVSLTVEGIVEGTLAWFHPSNRDHETDLFFALHGTIGIV
ncbi:MAG: hypothetical protein GY773_16375, partial [Actinomycetia bacterium]|nr:hypothetical protein [Actinomycetes bacterium]